MRGRLIVVSGTGTHVGKTHVSVALLLAWRASRDAARVVGLKPIETGVVDPERSDAASLTRASSFHVKHSGYALAPALSPHLAARQAGVLIDVTAIATWIQRVRNEADAIVVELPGGLFTPIGIRLHNVDLAVALEPDLLILVAPDRLGVLHDVVSVARATSTTHARIDGVILSAPEQPDPSTGLNAAELPIVSGVPVWATFPRADPEHLARLPETARILDIASSSPRRSDS
jgi:dethiobiotin synthetase